MLGFLVYFPTLVFVPHIANLLTAPFVAVKKFRVDEIINANTILILFIIALSFVNRILKPSLASADDIIPFSILVLLTYIISVALTRDNLKVIIYLVAIEVCIAWIERVIGISTFFKSSIGYESFGDTSLLYSSRPFGLSKNSSDLGEKTLIALLLLDYIKAKIKYARVIRLIILSGLLLSFVRSAIAAYAVYLFLFYAPLIIKSSLSFFTLRPKRRNIKILIVTGFFILTAFVTASFYSQEIVKQVTRNRGSLDISNREVLWPMVISFIADHPVFGNHSYKIRFDLYGTPNHAHNSYLQLIATHGAIIGLLYLLLVFANIKKRNFSFVVAVLFFSLGQYAIFWGISFMDIFLFTLLFNKKLAVDE